MESARRRDVAVNWAGAFADEHAEQAFRAWDMSMMYKLRAIGPGTLLALQLFCFLQDYLDVGDRDRRVAMTYIPVMVITLSVAFFFLIVGRGLIRDEAAGRSPWQGRRTWATFALAYRDFIWGSVILINAIAFQVRMVMICRNTTAESPIPCQVYKVGSFPLPPTLHAVACAGAFALLCHTFAAHLATTLAIVIALAGQARALYQPQDSVSARRNDLVLVTVLHVLAFGTLAIVGAQWPLYRRKQFLAIKALEQKLDEHRVMTEQLREADVREKQLLADKVRSAKQQMEERATLLRYLFHEIRVPLNTVSMGIELLQEDAKGLDSESSANLSMMKSACGTAITTLSDALDLSKLERSQNEPPPLKPTRILGLLEDAVSHNKPFAAGNSVQLSCEWQRPGLPEWVLGDPQGLKQVLNNFVTNAIKFCPKDGSGRVRVWAGLSLPPEALAVPLSSPQTVVTGSGVLSPPGSDHGRHATRWSQGSCSTAEDARGPSCILDQLTPSFLSDLAEQGFEVLPASSPRDGVVVDIGSCDSYTSPTGDAVGSAQGSSSASDDSHPVQMAHVYLAVLDNGVGISQEELPKLYSAFQQLDAGIQYKGRGTGLGLAISKGIVGRLQGSVSVRSAEGHGSVFYATVALPVLAQVEPPKRGVDAPNGAGAALGAPVGRQSPAPSLLVNSKAQSHERLLTPMSQAGTVASSRPSSSPTSATATTPGSSNMRVGRLGMGPRPMAAEPAWDVDRGRRPSRPTTDTVSADGLSRRSSRTGDQDRTSADSSQHSLSHISLDIPPSPRSVPGYVGGSSRDSEFDVGVGMDLGPPRLDTSRPGGRRGTSAPVQPAARRPSIAAGPSVGLQHPRTLFFGASVGSARGDGRPGSGNAAAGPATPRASSLTAVDLGSPEVGSPWPVPANMSPESVGTAGGRGRLRLQAHGLAEQSHAPHASPVPASGVRVLVVEDVLSNRTMLVKLLGKRWKGMGLAGMHGPLECDEAENGDLALQAVASAPPGHFTAVLMDGNMPVLDGYEATIRLRAEHNYTGLILGLTGNGLPADVERFREVGADDVLIKPADVTAVAHRIGQALDEWAAAATQP